MKLFNLHKTILIMGLLLTSGFNKVWADGCDAQIQVVGEPTFCHGTMATLEVTGITGTTIDWFRNGMLIASDTGFTINVTESGIYTAKATSDFECGWTTYTGGGFGPIEITFTPETPDISIVRFDNKLNLDFTSNMPNWEEDFTIQWYLDGVTIPNSNLASIIPDDYGSYIAIISDKYNCSSKSSNALSVQELPITIHTIYPNPSVDDIFIEYTCPDSENGILEIYDAPGRICYSQALNSEGNLAKVNMSDYQSGLYYIRITTASRISETRQFIRR